MVRMMVEGVVSKVSLQMYKSVGVVILNDGLNLLSRAFVHELTTILQTLDADSDVQCIVLKSESKVFSAGANVKELQAYCQLQLDDQDDPITHWQAVSDIKKPIIACVDGACLGGGLELALMCDFIYAGSNATFAFPEINLGLLPGGGGTQRILSRISLGRAKQMIMCGESINAATALVWGLVDAVHEGVANFEQALLLAQELAAKVGVPLRMTKNLLNTAAQQSESDLLQGLQVERACFYACMAHDESTARMDAFFNRKKT